MISYRLVNPLASRLGLGWYNARSDVSLVDRADWVL
jgi:hypothetical protein